jgi:hypothetical protein
MNNIFQLFSKLEFNDSNYVTSEEAVVKKFIEVCDGEIDIFLGESKDKKDYRYFGIVYRQNIFNPIGVKEFIYAGVSSSVNEKKLFVRPMEDWYNPKRRYAGKKVEDMREQIFQGKYTCETETVHVLYGNDHPTIQKALNVFEPHYIREIPESMKLNTAPGGGNYTKGRREASIIKENPHYEFKDEDTIFVAKKADLINFKDGEDYDYSRFYRRRTKKIQFYTIKYKDLTDFNKDNLSKNEPGKFKFDGNEDSEDAFMMNENQKRELEGIWEMDYRNDWDFRSTPCIYIEYKKDGFIDLEKSEGYCTITNACKSKKVSGSYATIRNYINESCYGFFKFDTFIEKYFEKRFKV